MVMFVRLALAIVTWLFLPASAGADADLTESDLMAVKQGVAERLLDPGSAIFSSISAAPPRPGGITAVCGLVNAKNAFGGYAGDKIFHGLLRKDGASLTFEMDILSTSEATVRAALALCREDGVVLR